MPLRTQRHGGSEMAPAETHDGSYPLPSTCSPPAPSTAAGPRRKQRPLGTAGTPAGATGQTVGQTQHPNGSVHLSDPEWAEGLRCIHNPGT